MYTYEQIYPLYRNLYFALGEKDAAAVSLGEVLPQLRGIASIARTSDRSDE